MKNGSTIDTAISTMMIHSSSSMRCVAAESATTAQWRYVAMQLSLRLALP